MWSDDWIGLPYLELGRSRTGCDCLGLFLMLQKERFGRDISDPLCTMHEAAKTHVIGKYQTSWLQVTVAQEGDAILFRAGRAWHIGFALGGKLMLHIEGKKGSLIEPFDAHLWGDRLEGIYRFGI